MPGRNSVADEQAWLNFAALDFLRQNLSSGDKVFEYGGGGSTLFFLRRTAFVATVENDREWFGILSAKIKEYELTHWQGFFIVGAVVSTDNTRRAEEPNHYKSNTSGQENLSYEEYAKAILQFPEEYFDVVLVDGRARPSCVAESFSRLKSGGLLIVDNMERPYYHTAFNERLADQFETLVQGRFPTPYHPDFTETRIWRKK